MNKAKDGSSILASKQPVVVRETTAELGDLGYEGVGALVMVMQMHIHVGNPEANDFRYAVEQIATVLFLRVEEGVLRPLARSVAGCVIRNPWPFIAPTSDTAKRGLKGSAHAQRLIVIGDRNPCTLRLGAPRAFPQAVLQIRHKPEFCVSRKVHGIDLLFAGYRNWRNSRSGRNHWSIERAAVSIKAETLAE
jgi:hypothetical protein